MGRDNFIQTFETFKNPRTQLSFYAAGLRFVFLSHLPFCLFVIIHFCLFVFRLFVSVSFHLFIFSYCFLNAEKSLIFLFNLLQILFVFLLLRFFCLFVITLFCLFYFVFRRIVFSSFHIFVLLS